MFIFMTTRIRVKINGSDAGKVLLIEDNWRLPEIIEAPAAGTCSSKASRGSSATLVA